MVRHGLPFIALQFPERGLHLRRRQFGFQANQVKALLDQRHKAQAFFARGRLNSQARIGRAAGNRLRDGGVRWFPGFLT